MDNAKRPTDDDNDDNAHTDPPSNAHDTEYGTEIPCPGGVIAIDIVSLSTNTSDNCIKMAFYSTEDEAINPAHACVPTKKQITYILGPLHTWLLNNLED